MCAHVADDNSLTHGSGGRNGCGSFHLTNRHDSDEPTTNLRGGVQFSTQIGQIRYCAYTLVHRFGMWNVLQFALTIRREPSLLCARART